MWVDRKCAATQVTVSVMLSLSIPSKCIWIGRWGNPTNRLFWTVRVAWSPDSIKAEPCGCAQKWPRFSGQNQGMIKSGNGSLNLFYVVKIWTYSWLSQEAPGSSRPVSPIKTSHLWQALSWRLAARSYYVFFLVWLYLTVDSGPSQNRACAIYAHGSSHGICRCSDHTDPNPGFRERESF